ncbi:hypothetical protein ACS0TY_006363 [Phlomoides rotata]
MEWKMPRSSSIRSSVFLQLLKLEWNRRVFLQELVEGDYSTLIFKHVDLVWI